VGQMVKAWDLLENYFLSQKLQLLVFNALKTLIRIQDLKIGILQKIRNCDLIQEYCTQVADIL
jgi:predicted nuclease of restriction endonuclease-like RecB superfamily